MKEAEYQQSYAENFLYSFCRVSDRILCREWVCDGFYATFCGQLGKEVGFGVADFLSEHFFTLGLL